MQPSLRFHVSAGLIATVAGALFLVFPSIVLAQDSSSSGTVPQKPRQATVITNDNIKLPVQPAPRPASSPAPQPASLVVTTPPPAADAAAKTSEIVALQKQIKEKQKRIELLMHLFATDERLFLQSPTDSQGDPTTQNRIRLEQEEIRAESAACARLQTRLDALTSGNPRP